MASLAGPSKAVLLWRASPDCATFLSPWKIWTSAKDRIRSLPGSSMRTWRALGTVGLSGTMRA